MATRTRPKPHRNGGQLLLDIPAAAIATPVPISTFLPAIPQGDVVVRYVEMGPAEHEELLSRSNTWSKDRGRRGEELVDTSENGQDDPDDLVPQDDPEEGGEPDEEAARRKKREKQIEVRTIASLTAIMRGEAFDSAGDPLVADRRGALLEGIKRSLAGAKSDRVHRVLLVQGIDVEARFSTDDTLKAVRRVKAPGRVEPLPALHAPAIDIARLNGRDRTAIDRALALREALAAELGYPLLPEWTVETLAASIAPSAPVASLRAPLHVAIASHALVAEVAPNHARRFMADWALGSLAQPSAAMHLATDRGRLDSGDELDFLAILALAIESFTAGEVEDPHALRKVTRRTRRQLLQVLGGTEGAPPARLISCAFETLDEDELDALLTLIGRHPDDWEPAEIQRIAPLVRDIRRDKGLVMTGQSIKISAGGRLLDGVDRAAACLLARRPLHSLVARGYREDHDPVRVRGRKQSIGHRLYADGYISPYDVQSLLGNVHRMSENDREERVTNTLLRHLHRKHSQAARSVMFVHDLKPLVEISAIGAAHTAMSRYSRDLADGFCSELFAAWQGDDVASETRHRILNLLVRELKTIKADRRGRNEDQTICIIVQAMNAWCREETIEAFGALPRRGFVKLAQPPQIADLQERLAREAGS